MINIRNGCWETNSSSSHTYTFDANRKLPEVVIFDEDQELLEAEWEFEAYDPVLYAVVQVLMQVESAEQAIDIFKQAGVTLELRNVTFAHCDWNGRDQYQGNSHIDHQSVSGCFLRPSFLAEWLMIGEVMGGNDNC